MHVGYFVNIYFFINFQIFGVDDATHSSWLKEIKRCKVGVFFIFYWKKYWSKQSNSMGECVARIDNIRTLSTLAILQFWANKDPGTIFTCMDERHLRQCPDVWRRKNEYNNCIHVYNKRQTLLTHWDLVSVLCISKVGNHSHRTCGVVITSLQRQNDVILT